MEEEEGEEGSVVAVAVVVVDVAKAGWKTLSSSRTGASRSCCCKPSSCWRLLRLWLLLRRGIETRAKAETRRGGSGERASGRLEGGVGGVGVEGPGGAAALGASSSASPPTPLMLPFPSLNFFFPLFDADKNSCLIIREGEVREGCGGVVVPSGEAMASTLVVFILMSLVKILRFLPLSPLRPTRIRIPMLAGD